MGIQRFISNVLHFLCGREAHRDCKDIHAKTLETTAGRNQLLGRCIIMRTSDNQYCRCPPAVSVAVGCEKIFSHKGERDGRIRDCVSGDRNAIDSNLH